MPKKKGGENPQPLRKHTMFLILICIKKVKGISTRFFSSFFTVNICVYARWSAQLQCKRDTDLQYLFFNFPPPIFKTGLKSLLVVSHQCVNKSCCKMETGSLLKIVYILGIYIIRTSHVKCNHFYGISLTVEKECNFEFKSSAHKYTHIKILARPSKCKENCGWF